MSFTAAFLRLVGLLLSLALPSLAFGSEAEFIGHWGGTMVRDGVPLEVSFDFKASGPHPSGTFTSLSQKAMDYPLDVLAISRTRFGPVQADDHPFVAISMAVLAPSSP
jgi:hypothetical protein